MTMAKAIFAALLGVLLLSPVVAVAQTSVYQSVESSKAHNAGRVQGRIVSIDYSAGQIVVDTGHGRTPVAVVPSTTFYHGRQYETLSDLRVGQRVDIAASEVNGSLVAQTIRF
jgi:hypothetical protein